MSDLHKGRVVWVTGAASGIGRATVEEIISEGGQVVGSDLPDADFTWADSVDEAFMITGDVTDPDHNEIAVGTALEEFGRIDGAVLNAGLAGRVDLFDGPIESFDRVMEVNVRAVVLGIRACAAVMRPGSAITVTASTSGMRGDPGMWVYNASKSAVINLVRSASMDLAGRGIRINAICPGPTETGMTTRFEGDPYEDMRRRIPLQRWGHAREVAAGHSFLLSGQASFITGAHLPVDGGISANSGQFTPPEFTL
ncbi:MAG: SDR family oxidoreductase [Actinomycetota bacterium]|nr:SDR family oxidoreductase [Actinomycetota bacterium]